MKKQKSTNRKPVVKTQTPTLVKETINLQNSYLLQGDSLLPLSKDYYYPENAVEKKFRLAKELEELVFKNSKTLFGQNTFLIRINIGLFGSIIFPNIFLIDIGNPAKPRVYFLDFVFARQDFYGETFRRVTKLFSYLKTEENVAELLEFLKKDKTIKADETFLLSLLNSKLGVILFSDDVLPDLEEIKQVCNESWQAVKQITVKKYATKDSSFCLLTPPYLTLQVNGKRVKNDSEGFTENDHLQKSSPEIQAVYEKIKADLLKTNKELSFNPKRYYVGLKNGRNIAFFISQRSIFHS